ncbi:Uncharacterised protein [Enterobacter cancerogenus]|uniref:Uncharacterized protein n=1 Tax=Enterobacter cancerogenus TaxID=69218 RepID=A0A484Z637_9ENTR|nr:Uncharacterised protein [Enterobacter cancerogenus]
MFSCPGSRLITAPSRTPESMSGATLWLSNGGQVLDAAGMRAARLSDGGSQGSSGSGHTSSNFLCRLRAVCCHAFSGTIHPDGETDPANAFLLRPAAGLAARCPPASQVERRRRQFSLPSGSDCPPGQQMVPAPYAGGTRIARQTGLINRGTRLKQIVDLV